MMGMKQAWVTARDFQTTQAADPSSLQRAGPAESRLKAWRYFLFQQSVL